MKRNSAKKQLTTGIIALCLIMLGFKVHAQTRMESFAGTWVLNEDKSDFGRLTAKSASKIRVLIVEQTAGEITIASGDSTMKTMIEINLRGKQSSQVSSTTIYGIPNTMRTNIDLQIINSREFTSALNKDPMSMVTSSVKTYTLSADGKTLTMEYKNAYGESILAGKLVYDKKQ